MLDYTPKPQIFSIANGDYIIVRMNRSGKITFTSTDGDYELERQFGAAYGAAMVGIMEADSVEPVTFEMTMIVDH